MYYILHLSTIKHKTFKMLSQSFPSILSIIVKEKIPQAEAIPELQY